jgi:hemerythrin-like domain-containing protein
MSGQPGGYLALSLIAIHDVITRGLEVSTERAQEFAAHGFRDEEEKAGFLNYVRTLVAVLEGHHLTEDDIAFPYLRDKLPEAPVDLLMAQHQMMIPVLGEIRSAVERCEKEAQVETGLSDMRAALNQVDGIWHPHIRIEQEHIIEKADAVLPVEEQVKLVQLAGEHSQQHSGPPYLAVPFLLYNLDKEERAVFARAMPAEVTDHLVPVVWKEQWASMAPFLLE